MGSNDALLGLTLAGYFLRGLGMILMGAGLYRLGFMNGGMSTRTYRLTAAIGLGLGLPLAAASVIVTAMGDYSREVAFIGQVPNTLGTIPASLGYMSLIVLWNRGGRRQQVETAAPRYRQDGVDQLPEPDGSGGSRAHCPAGRRGRESERDSALRSGGLGSAALVVASLAQPFPFRPSRMAMACCDLSSGAAVATGLRLSPDALLNPWLTCSVARCPLTASARP